jgi:trk system potassium uptake protein TrkH
MMVLPALVDAADGNSGWRVFFVSSVLTFFIGGLLLLIAYDDKPMSLSIKQGFLLTALSWLVLPAFAAIPFIGLGLPIADAYFEATSGLTTTGSTVIAGLDKLPRGILLWRALLMGVGGLGIVVMAIIMLPALRVGGMQLFQTESSERSEKILPRATELVAATSSVYFTLILLAVFVFAVLGMDIFDAVCHALATVATGGFSTHDTSYAFFQSPAIEWAAVVFMILGALPFVVFIRALRGEPLVIWRDAQVRGFLLLLAVLCMVMTAWLVYERGQPFGTALRLAVFNVTSILTTSGFSTDDYTTWGTFAVGLFFLMTFLGGCSGSTTGGIKIYRLQVSALLTRSHLLHLISPNRVVTLSYNGRRLPPDVPFSVIAFLAIYMATIGFFSLLLAAMGLDFVTALSSAATAVSNVGPGLGDTVGPAGNFSGLPAPAKIVLSFAMVLGRLELFTVFVLLLPTFWRK